MHQFRHILIATDFSPAAWQAIKAGVSLAKEPASKVSLLHVYPYRSDHVDQNEQNHFDSLERKITKMADELGRDHGLQIESVIRRGSVSDAIANFVKKKNIDLILMGTNSGNLDSHLGTQTTLVIESCSLPVLVVPPIFEKSKVERNTLNQIFL